MTSSHLRKLKLDADTLLECHPCARRVRVDDSSFLDHLALHLKQVALLALPAEFRRPRPSPSLSLAESSKEAHRGEMRCVLK